MTAIDLLASAREPATGSREHLEVQTLGPLRVRIGTREPRLGPPKQQAVLAVLALRGNGFVSRDDLIDALWGEDAPTTAAGSLHTYVSGLRRALGRDALVSSGPGYALALAPGSLDLASVERLAAAARGERDLDAAAALLDKALAHWRPGSVLNGVPGPFAERHRRRAADLRLELQMERADLLLELGRTAGLAERLRELVVGAPYHERLRSLLISALHRSGRTADALAEYRDLRRTLAGELGIEPSPPLRALHTAILAREEERPPLPRVRPAQLPRGAGRFVGREKPLRELLDAAGDGGSRIAMIVGVGGAGKTELAVRSAHLLSGGFPDGQIYANLRGFDPAQPPRAPEEILRRLLASLHPGAMPAEHEDRVALWRSLVRDRRMLIVLDDAATADQVEDLLPGGGPSFVLLTSRSRLSGLAVRYSARRITLGPLTPTESLDLLRSSLGGDRVAGEPEAARRLTELCGHLPLALRIAAEQAGSRIADLAADLADERRRLDTLRIPEDEPCSVRAVLSVSYERLDAASARAFRVLGLFPGATVRPEAAAALLSVPEGEATTALRVLAAQHLVDASGDGYAMHDLTRIYAAETARTGETADSRRDALARLLGWYTRSLERCGGQAARLARCAAEWENLAPLVPTAHRIGRHDLAARLTVLFQDHYRAAGRDEDWLEGLRLGTRGAELSGNRHAHAVLLGRTGTAHARAGRHDRALPPLRRALRSTAELGDEGLRAALLAELAGALGSLGDANALPTAREALALARRSAPEHAGRCLAALASLSTGDEAASLGRAALREARLHRDVLLEAEVLIGLGRAEGGNHHRFGAALALTRATGDRHHEAQALLALAAADTEHGRDLADRAQAGLTALGAAGFSALPR